MVTPDLSLGRYIVFRTSFCVILSNFDDWPEFNIVFSVCSTFRAIQRQKVTKFSKSESRFEIRVPELTQLVPNFTHF